MVTCTQSTAMDLERSHGLPRDSTAVVPLGVDLDRFRPLGPRTANEVPYLFHLSSDDPREHTSVVINAFARVVAHIAEPIRLIVGGGLGPSRQPLLDLVASLGLGRRVETLGRLSDERLVELYSGVAQPCSRPWTRDSACNARGHGLRVSARLHTGACHKGDSRSSRS